MAAIKYARGTKLLLKFGDGEAPEVFTHACSINASRSIQFTAEENTSVIPDCADLNAPGWIVSDITSKRVTASGSGMLNTPDFDALHAWWDSSESRNAKLVIDVSAADGGRIISAAFKILTLEVSGEKDGKIEISISIASDGPATVADNT